ncbi:MAG: hypothetical protein QNL62_02805 [Gammaproteobacteria bacterium]|nr:hypothetical protein [Gammaproteobacteria bacterium]
MTKNGKINLSLALFFCIAPPLLTYSYSKRPHLKYHYTFSHEVTNLMEQETQLAAEIIELQGFIDAGKQQGEPKHLLKMYQTLIKSKKVKLKQLLYYGGQ